ncbi:MAG: FliI/YscN family ATPase [Pirellulales bacterium]|nr:FliI/YscN family ATPase [Pirellulales bacterium]
MLSLFEQLATAMPTRLIGHVVATDGMTISVSDFPAPVGAHVQIERQTDAPIAGEVIGFRDRHSIVYPLGKTTGVRRGNRVRLVRTNRVIRVGNELLGRLVNAFGQCIDGRPQPALACRAPLEGSAPSPTDRPRISTPLATGIRAIDGMLTCGQGQRMGIFAGSGIGKSILLGLMARRSAADVIVIGLIGERGREVNEFVERDLGPDGLERSVVVVATSNEPAVIRVRAAQTANTIAEYFRDQGNHVLLLVDSISRLASAQREIGLAAGEPPTTRGYPPSVFGLLPRIIERAGRTRKGSITAFYSVLVEGDDQNEPIADAVRGLLDGHTWLSRPLAAKGHYPAIDVLDSISRLMNDVTTPEHREAAKMIRSLLSALREHEDMIAIGAYRRGTNPLVDAAIDMRQEMDAFLQQKTDEITSFELSQQTLAQLAAKCRMRQAAIPAHATIPAPAATGTKKAQD